MKCAELYCNINVGVLYSVDNAQTTISNSVMFNNTARSGGCIFLDFNSTVTVVDSQLNSNSATDIGGVLNAGGTAVVSICTVCCNSQAACLLQKRPGNM